MARWDLSPIIGETITRYYWEGSESEPTDLTGREFEGWVWYGPGQSGDPVALIDCDLVAHPTTEDPNSAVLLTLETEGMAPMNYFLEVWCTHTDGTREQILAGTLKLRYADEE